MFVFTEIPKDHVLSKPKQGYFLTVTLKCGHEVKEIHYKPLGEVIDKGVQLEKSKCEVCQCQYFQK